MTNFTVQYQPFTVRTSIISTPIFEITTASNTVHIGDILVSTGIMVNVSVATLTANSFTANTVVATTSVRTPNVFTSVAQVAASGGLILAVPVTTSSSSVLLAFSIRDSNGAVYRLLGLND